MTPVPMNRWRRPARAEAVAAYLPALVACIDAGVEPSQRELAARTGLAERSVRRVERHLEDAGVVTVTRRQGLPRTVQLDWDAARAFEAAGVCALRPQEGTISAS